MPQEATNQADQPPSLPSVEDNARNSDSLMPASGVIGKVKLESVLATGGMGAIYRGRHDTLDIKVAVKILPRELAENHEYVTCLFQEARAAAKINHPNVVRVYDCGEENGIFYIVMELVEGLSCDKIMEKHGRFPEREATRIVRSVARALDEITKHGMLHRDIKPANILIGPDGTVKLTDLGLAMGERVNRKEGNATVYRYATPEYMAPEMGIYGAVVDQRSDIYCLGATFYHLLTGQYLFQDGTPAELMRMHAEKTPPSVRDLAPEVSIKCARVIEHMLAKDPAARYQNAHELLVALSDIDGVAPDSMAGGAGHPEAKSLHDLSSAIVNTCKCFQNHAAEFMAMGGAITMAAGTAIAVMWAITRWFMGWTGLFGNILVIIGAAAVTGPLIMGLFMATMQIVRASPYQWQFNDLFKGFLFFPAAFCIVLAPEMLNAFAMHVLQGPFLFLGAVVSITTKAFMSFAFYLMVTKQAQLQTVARKSLRLMTDDYVGAFIVGFTMWLFEYTTAIKLHPAVYLVGLSVLLPFIACLVFHFRQGRVSTPPA